MLSGAHGQGATDPGQYQVRSTLLSSCPKGPVARDGKSNLQDSEAYKRRANRSEEATRRSRNYDGSAGLGSTDPGKYTLPSTLLGAREGNRDGPAGRKGKFLPNAHRSSERVSDYSRPRDVPPPGAYDLPSTFGQCGRQTRFGNRISTKKPTQGRSGAT